jgi:hypothetical protein
MAKAASPIRLQEGLMQSASLTGKRFHRSTAEQIEYWAELGRQLSSTLDPDVLLSISAGLAKLTIEPVEIQPVEPDDVFQKLEQDRQKGTLPRTVASSAIKYQSSQSCPGYLEQIDASGHVKTGRFERGEFVTNK